MDICESCRFGYIEPNDDGYYCEALDDVFKMRTQCGKWACKLSRIGTPLELEHNCREIERKRSVEALKNCLAEPKCTDCPWTECENMDEPCRKVPTSLLRTVLALLEGGALPNGNADCVLPLLRRGDRIH